MNEKIFVKTKTKIYPIEKIDGNAQKGDLIELIYTPDKPIELGAKGIVASVYTTGAQNKILTVEWEKPSYSKFVITVGIDHFIIIEKKSN